MLTMVYLPCNTEACTNLEEDAKHGQTVRVPRRLRKRLVLVTVPVHQVQLQTSTVLMYCMTDVVWYSIVVSHNEFYIFILY
jgi:hypothetical protein